MGILDDPTSYVDFLCTHKLSPNQFLLCYLLYTEHMIRDKESNLRYATVGNIYKYCDKGTGWSNSDVEDLIEKGYLIDTTKTKDTYAIDRLILTEKFVDLMFINANFAFEEFFEAYPNSTMIDGKAAFLKAVDPDVVAERYKKAIKNSAVKHAEIMEIIAYAKENNLINMRVDKFVMGKLWEAIKTQRDEKGEGYGKSLY